MSSNFEYKSKPIINARGTFTPLGVSRSSEQVANSVAQSLQHYYDMEDLLDHADRIITSHCGAEAATLVNCASAGITLAIAASITGTDPDKIARMPDTNGLPNKVLLAMGHYVNYGHPIEQDIRLAGCFPVPVGSKESSCVQDYANAISEGEIATILYVESRLTSGSHPEIKELVDLAHKHNIPLIVDAAAQDMRMGELVATGADTLIFSAQKYLAAPTAGIIVGKRTSVKAIRAQGKGIGRSMKTGKESIIGTIKAIEERQSTDMTNWAEVRKQEAAAFADKLSASEGLKAELVEDPSKGDFYRIDLRIDEGKTNLSAQSLSEQLQKSSPAIYCNAANAKQAILNFEILALLPDEQQQIIDRILELVDQARNTRS